MINFSTFEGRMSLKLALAQIASTPGDIKLNILKHVDWILKASQENADAIFFPELSLIGYEPTLAKGLAMHKNDKLLKVFQGLSDEHKIVIGVGLPLQGAKGTTIGMIIYQPQKPSVIYEKQILHHDELPFFSCGSKNQVVEIRGIRVGIAICYESLNRPHFLSYHKEGIDVYLTSVAKPQSNTSKAHSYFASLTSKYETTVAMVNAVGHSDDFISAGQSAIWSNQGQLVITASEQNEELLFVG